MALKYSNFANSNKLTIFVHCEEILDPIKSNAEIGFVAKGKESLETVLSYLKETGQREEKIFQALSLVHFVHPTFLIKSLTNTERKKVELARVLLLSSKIIVCDHFFEELIFQEKDYFKRFFRNLSKKGIAVILFEDNMNFICETVKEFYLFLNSSTYKKITNFYDEEIYQYVSMPFSIELIKYFEQKGHKIDHEITFDETLKAIYRGAS